MAITLPNLGLVVWNAPDDPYNSGQLAQNLYRIDEHDHSPGKGRPLSPDALSDGAVGTLKLADLSVTTPKIADGAVTVPKVGSVLRDVNTDALQEGVVAAGDGAVTRPASATLRVAAGTAWIDGDGVNGLTGRYRVTWPQTDLTVPSATGVNFRGHRVVIPLPTNGHGTSAPVLRSGPDDASVNLDSLNTAGTVAGVPAIASGELQVAVAISDSGGVPSTGFRDRRRFARGYRARYRHITTGGTSTTSTGLINMFAGLGDVRIEASSANIIDVCLDGHVVAPPSGGPSTYSIYLYLNDPVAGGILLQEWRFRDTFDAHVSLRYPHFGVSGTFKYRWYHGVSVAGQTGKLLIDTTSAIHADVTVREVIGGVNGNGTV